MNRNLVSLVPALVVGALLSACGSSVNLKDVPVETRSPTQVTEGAGAGSTAPQSQVATVQAGTADSSNAATEAALRAAGRVVYFDFDSFAVRDDGKRVVDAHAKVLVGDRARRMVIEGHTDERGGREYNLALGQKRALAVLNSMTLLGVSPTQLEAVSFGKERAAVEGSSEEAWAKNRRAEIKDVR